MTRNYTNDLFSAAENRGRTEGLMSTDVREFEDRYELSINLPGFSKDNVQLDLQDGTLTILASRSRAEIVEGEKRHLSERFMGKCRRSFYIGEGTTNEDISASLTNGVLFLTVRKHVPEKPKAVTIHID